MNFLILSVLASLFAGSEGQTKDTPLGACPLLGPSYTKPTNLAQDAGIKSAAQVLTEFIHTGLEGGLLDNQTTAFSLTAFSTSDPDSKPFFTFHQTPPILEQSPTGVKEVTGNSVYRVGSVSKVLTAYTLLVVDGFKHFHDSVQELIPQLKESAEAHDDNDHTTSTAWNEVTLEALASHLSGIGKEYGAMDIAKSPFPYTEIGLPKIPDNQNLPCGGPVGFPLCTPEQFLKGIVDRHPVFPPYHSPSYSDGSFTLLAYAMEGITGDKFSDLLETKVFKALNMTHSSYGKPDDSLGVIPAGFDSLWWDTELGGFAAGGGFYSSPLDLATFGRAVLSSRQLTPGHTRRWMRPLSHTSNLRSSVGAPWEINRYTLPNDPAKTVDLYAKSGKLGLYTAYLVLIPDYDIGFSVNVVGPGAELIPLLDSMTENFVPAVEEAARLQTDKRYSGKYVSKDNQYSFTLSTSSDAPGIHLTNFTGPEDSNELATLAVLASVAAGRYSTAEEYIPFFLNGSLSALYESGMFGFSLDLRLFPTTLEGTLKYNDKSSKLSYRAAVQLSTSGDPGPFNSPCETWQVIDSVSLGGKSFDEFIFHLDEKGNIAEIEHSFLRQSFTRKA